MKLQHYLGGLEGLGPVDLREARLRRALGEAHLRHPRRDDGAELATAAAGDARAVQHGVDLGRPAQGRGSLNPFDYFKYRYYEKWLGGISGYFVEKGYITQAELDARTEQIPANPSSAAKQGGDPAIDAARRQISRRG